MRKLVLFGVCAMFATSAMAGAGGLKKVVPVSPPEAEGRPSGPIQSINPSIYAIGPGDSLGSTVSDYGTNGSACHNLINYGDGTLSLGRMTAWTDDFADRGTHYSYSDDDGVTWTPLTWIEGTRQGWGNIDQFPAAGGTEVTYAHVTPVANCIDAAKGANVWTCSDNGSIGLWPRLAVTDPFSIHVVHADANPAFDILYTRSTDAGVSWDILDQSLFTGPGFYADADAQDIASFGSNIAIINAPQPDGLQDVDILLAVSTDNGATWAEQVLYDMKGPGELPEGEEEYQCDGAVACVYDNAGNLHVTWTNFLAIGNASNDPELFFDITAPIMYWSEATGIIEIAPVLTDDAILPASSQFGNTQTQPDIGVDALGNPHIKFQQYISEVDINGVNYQHIYAMSSPDGGSTWTTPEDITPGTGFDASFGSMADLVDDFMHITYFSDPLGGNAVRGNHEFIPVAVMYLKAPVAPSCGFSIASTEEQYYPGSDIEFEVSIHHKREATVTVPINAWVEDRHRRTVSSTTSKPLTIHEGDFLGVNMTISLPQKLSPGRYMLKSSIGEMKQGTASAQQSFTVEEGTVVSDVNESSDNRLETIPETIFLGANYPNPFNPSTTISYGLSRDSHVSLKIYTTLGQEMATLVDDFQTAGYQSVVWNGRDNFWKNVSSGIYLYRMRAGDFVETRKLLLLK